MSLGKIYLIPAVLHEDEKAIEAIPAYVLNAVKNCQVFFVENEKTARRFLKRMWKEMVIDNYKWYAIHKAEEQITFAFINHLKEGKNIGIISEAGCPCIADPGQILVEAAQNLNAQIVPLVGPSSIFLALMASGMNGQSFQFAGYLPIDSNERKKAIKELEEYSFKKNCTQIFIETPYRNNQMLKDILQSCRNETKLCIAVNITSALEKIQTKKINDWKISVPELHQQQCIFLLYSK